MHENKKKGWFIKQVCVLNFSTGVCEGHAGPFPSMLVIYFHTSPIPPPVTCPPIQLSKLLWKCSVLRLRGPQTVPALEIAIRNTICHTTTTCEQREHVKSFFLQRLLISCSYITWTLAFWFGMTWCYNSVQRIDSSFSYQSTRIHSCSASRRERCIWQCRAADRQTDDTSDCHIRMERRRSTRNWRQTPKQSAQKLQILWLWHRKNILRHSWSFCF